MLALVGENQPFIEWWEQTTQPLPDRITSGDIICAGGAVICPAGPFVGRTPLAVSLLKGLQGGINRVIQNLRLQIPELGLSRTDGVIDEPTVRIVAAILRQTVSDAPVPDLGQPEMLAIEVAQQAPGLIRYLRSARLPPVEAPSPAAAATPPSKAPSGMSTAAKVAVGVGVVAAVWLGGRWLIKRRG